MFISFSRCAQALRGNPIALTPARAAVPFRNDLRSAILLLLPAIGRQATRCAAVANVSSVPEPDSIEGRRADGLTVADTILTSRRRRGRRECGHAMARSRSAAARRYLCGDMPVHNRNARLKADSSEYPSARAASVRLMSGSAT